MINKMSQLFSLSDDIMKYYQILQCSPSIIQRVNNLYFIFELQPVIIIFKMSIKTPTHTPNCPQQIKQTDRILIEKDDQQKVVDAKRKIRILKQGLLEERKNNTQLQDQIYQYHQKLKKMELQNKRRQQKNQGLLLEIRSLKDSLITEKTEKQQLLLEVRQKQREEKQLTNGQSKMTFSNMFGLKSLFQK